MMNATFICPLISIKASIVDKGFVNGVIKLRSDIWRYIVTFWSKEMPKLLLKSFIIVFGFTDGWIAAIPSFSIKELKNSISVGLNSNPNLSKLSLTNFEISFSVVLGFSSLNKVFRSTEKFCFLWDDESSPYASFKTDF